jgi:hypothetical protein
MKRLVAAALICLLPLGAQANDAATIDRFQEDMVILRVSAHCIRMLRPELAMDGSAGIKVLETWFTKTMKDKAMAARTVRATADSPLPDVITPLACEATVHRAPAVLDRLRRFLR